MIELRARKSNQETIFFGCNHWWDLCSLILRPHLNKKYNFALDAENGSVAACLFHQMLQIF